VIGGGGGRGRDEDTGATGENPWAESAPPTEQDQEQIAPEEAGPEDEGSGEAGADTAEEASGAEEWQLEDETSEPQDEVSEEEGSEPPEEVSEEAGSEPQLEASEEEDSEPDAGREQQRSSALAGEAAAGPSMGPHTDVSKFHEGREESLEKAAHASDTDAMGRDKRRQVVGGTYGMTTAKLTVLYATVVAVIAGAAFGLYLLAKDLDQPPEKISTEAPWAEQDAPQRPTRAIQ
jgi:hypothetical protein